MRALILAPFSDDGLARLRRGGIDVAYESWLDTQRLQDPEVLGARIAAEEIGVLIVEADFVFEEVFEAAPCLRLVGVCRNAVNQVDIEAAAHHGVVVTHAPGRNTNAVAELTIGALLSLFRRIPQAHNLVAGGAWSDPSAGYRLLRGREVAGATIGVVGFGQIGREVTRKCIALGATVLVYDPLVPARDIEATGGRQVELHDLASRADAVTLHVPDVESTRGMIDAAFLERMRRGAFIINTSTGAAIDVAALIEALDSGSIAGAALDVFEGQPLPASSPLLSAPNLLLTPHIGGATDETIRRHSEIMASEVERYLAGEPLKHAVTPVPVSTDGR